MSRTEKALVAAIRSKLAMAVGGGGFSFRDGRADCIYAGEIEVSVSLRLNGEVTRLSGASVVAEPLNITAENIEL